MNDHIYILPGQQLPAGISEPPRNSAHYLRPLAGREWTCVPSGKAALNLILQNLLLAPEDEVFVTNSSGQTYISSCVTCTVFNYCKPSRVLSDRCKAILVIHEYGRPHPQTKWLAEQAALAGIPLIEDCAHTMDSSIEGTVVGHFGDFALFSLPKLFPAHLGGILSMTPSRASRLPPSPSHPEAEELLAQHGPHLEFYSMQRKKRFDGVRDRYPQLPVLFEAGPDITPTFIGLITPKAGRIHQATDNIEFGSTLREDLLLIPTNPLVAEDVFFKSCSKVLDLHART